MVESKRLTSLAGLKSNIARVDSAAKSINAKKPELERYNNDAKKLSRTVDIVNRNAVREGQEKLRAA